MPTPTSTLVSRLLPFALLLALGGCSDEAPAPAGPPEVDAGLDETPQPRCGDGVVDEGELCDGAPAAGASCESLGYSGGTLGCRADCRAHSVGDCTLESTELTATALGLAIPDNGYDGSIESMRCVDLDATGMLGVVEYGSVEVELGIDHSFVGDLVVKLVTPRGGVTTLMHRPGFIASADDGNGSGGANANLSPDHPITITTRPDVGEASAEDLGAGLASAATVCASGPCAFRPSAPAFTSSNLPRQPLAGPWKVCVGDAAGGDDGTLDSVRLRFDPTPVHGWASVGNISSSKPIPDGTFSGAIDGMACIDVTPSTTGSTFERIVADVNLSHTSVGQLVAVVVADGEVYGLMSRPGVLEAADYSPAIPGASADVVSQLLVFHADETSGNAPAESLGESLPSDGIVCGGAMTCDLDPDVGGSGFRPLRDLVGRTIPETIRVCVGDSTPGETGTFAAVTFNYFAGP